MATTGTAEEGLWNVEALRGRAYKEIMNPRRPGLTGRGSHCRAIDTGLSSFQPETRDTSPGISQLAETKIALYLLIAVWNHLRIPIMILAKVTPVHGSCSHSLAETCPAGALHISPT